MIQISKILKQVPIFHMLDKESIDFIVERMKFKTFAANQTICQIGDPGDEMFIIITGKVKICIYNEDGSNEQVVATLGGGDYFGEMALLTGETRSASVIATEDCEMFVLHKNDFDVILEKYPSISLSMGKIVSQRLRDTLSKASKLPASGKLEFSQEGPSGTLKDVPLVDLIAFCESNSLTGTMTVKRDGREGNFEFESGQLNKVTLDDSRDDEALDTMLGWDDGQFEIRVRPLKLKKESQQEQQVKHILIVNNSMVVRKVVERAFKGLGYAVSTAATIADAVPIAKKTKADVIISDIKLADGSSEDLIAGLSGPGELPFIFLADENLKPVEEKQLLDHPRVQITKSHEVSEIVKLVERLF